MTLLDARYARLDTPNTLNGDLSINGRLFANPATGEGVHSNSTDAHGVFSMTTGTFMSGVSGYNPNTSGGVGVSGTGFEGIQGGGILHGVFGEVPGAAPCDVCPAGLYSAGVAGNAHHQYAYGVHAGNDAANGTALRGFATGANGIGVDAFAMNGGTAGVFYQNGTGDIIKGFGPTGNFVVGGDGSLTITGNAFKPGGGSWSTLSDARAKTSIQAIERPLQRFLSLKGVTFEYSNPSAFSERPGVQMGMVAQDVEQAFPSWIDVGADGYRRLTFRGFEALAVEAVRELRADVHEETSALERRFDLLTEENAQLRGEIEEIKSLLLLRHQ